MNNYLTRKLIVVSRNFKEYLSTVLNKLLHTWSW